jgi:carbamoyl-phosphate synthase large subunit
MVGQTLAAQGVAGEIVPKYFSVKEAVFPFIKFPGVDTILGPEMKSTGEVMGMGSSFGEAYHKSQLAAGTIIPRGGRAFLSVKTSDRAAATEVARYLAAQGFELVATRGTAAVLADAGIPVEPVNKVKEGRPHIVDMIKNRQIDLIVNTTEGRQSIADSYEIRRQALNHRVTYFTTLAAARAACEAHRAGNAVTVSRLQTVHKVLAA